MENEEILPHTCPSMAGLVFQLAGDDDLVDIEEFLLIHFFPVEPLGSLVKVDVQIEVRPWLARFVANVVSERRSIIVRDVSTSPNQLVAVRLNSLEIKGESHDGLPVNAIEHPRMVIVADILHRLCENFDLYELYGVDRVFHLVMVAVSEQYGRRGIAGRLLDLSVRVARRDGVRVVIMKAASVFAAKLAARASFQMLHEILYNEFDYNATKPFANSGVHQRIQLMVLHM